MSTFFQQTAQAETFAKKSFPPPRQPKPKHRFLAVGEKGILQRSRIVFKPSYTPSSCLFFHSPEMVRTKTERSEGNEVEAAA